MDPTSLEGEMLEYWFESIHLGDEVAETLPTSPPKGLQPKKKKRAKLKGAL